MTQEKTDKYQMGASCNHVLRNALSFTLMFYHLIFICVLTEEWTPPHLVPLSNQKNSLTHNNLPSTTDVPILGPWDLEFSVLPMVMTDQFDTANKKHFMFWLVVLAILKNMKVNGKDYPIYY